MLLSCQKKCLQSNRNSTGLSASCLAVSLNKLLKDNPNQEVLFEHLVPKGTDFYLVSDKNIAKLEHMLAA